MKRSFLLIAALFTKVATWFSHISLRGFVVMMGLVLALSAPRNAQLEFIDNLVLSGISNFFPSPLGTSGIAIIEVPKDEIAIWQSDIHASGKLAALLANILNSSESVVALVLEQPIDTGAAAADVLIETLVKQNKRNKTAKTLVDRKYILLDLLKNERAVLGTRRFIFADQAPLLTQRGREAALQSQLYDLFWPPCKNCFSERDAVVVGRPRVEQNTILDPASPHYQMLYRSAEGEMYPGFLVNLLRVLENVDAGDKLLWRKGGVLTLGALAIPVSPDGSLVPLNTLSPRMKPIVDTIALDDALARSAFPALVFIASPDNRDTLTMAQTIYSIRHNNTLYSPWWASPLIVGLMLFSTCYLGFVAARLSVKAASIVSFSFFLGLLAMQGALIAFKSIWIPLALPLLWLAAGHFLLSVGKIKKLRIKRLVDRADSICIAEAKRLIEKRELDAARAMLAGCSVKDALLHTLYEISESYTEAKSYDKAIHVLKMIRQKKKGFKDTEQKLLLLSTMKKSASRSKSVDALQKTMIIDAEQNLRRTLGRYRLEREIGRGAMGQVFLGFDPRISRRVAIKTMSYDNFRGKSLDGIKTRFFREAEAAGRLSHPSIVSVFDVGEERGCAYIAMDYVEGQALNQFVDPANLLPVFEVYRIISDVASALQYAHNNNIVHRDIKPGNIIYNPSPYKVKVTDFGIARLTDDSNTSTGEILGSPLYMAPEQLKGKRVNYSADIFSLGVTFYQLLTGHLPYKGENLAALTYEIIHGKHKAARSVRKSLPASASRITNQALQKDPEDRYESAAELAMIIKKSIKRDFASEARKAGYI